MCTTCDQRNLDLVNRVLLAQRLGKPPLDEFGGPITVLTDTNWMTTNTVSVVRF